MLSRVQVSAGGPAYEHRTVHRLRPGVAPAILGAPAADTIDLDLDLNRLWGDRR
jgi:hypothetical protein